MLPEHLCVIALVRANVKNDGWLKLLQHKLAPVGLSADSIRHIVVDAKALMGQTQPIVIYSCKSPMGKQSKPDMLKNIF